MDAAVAPSEAPGTAPALGRFALPPAVEGLRRLAARLGRGPVARRVVSILRRIVWAGRPDPFDVEVWPGQWARLYPRDNL
ncbi:MAG: hypothetical protein AAFQ88_08255, partial [Pseudomonadota bacterium]